MFNNFLVRRLLESQLKGVPEEQKKMLIGLLEKNPDFFTKLATEIKAEVDKGADKQGAAMKVIKSHEAELKSLLSQK